MVKLGIICEGESETIIFDDSRFKTWLKSFGIELISVQETGSKNQFFGGRYNKHKATMKDKGVDVILALFDLDKDACPIKLKLESDLKDNEIGVVAVKEFENWYLADQESLSKLIEKNVTIDLPESFEEPIKEIIRLNNNKGFGRSKPRLAQKMLSNGFTIQNAANHPNCQSAQYFIKKLESISKKVI